MAEEKKKELPEDVKARLKAGFDLEWRKELRKSMPAKERARIPRQKMPERPAEVRSSDFGEVNQGLPAAAALLEAKRCLDCPNSPCVAGCPVAIDIPSFIKLIEKG